MQHFAYIAASGPQALSPRCSLPSCLLSPGGGGGAELPGIRTPAGHTDDSTTSSANPSRSGQLVVDFQLALKYLQVPEEAGQPPQPLTFKPTTPR